MVRAVPPGGNWRDIPESIPSKRLEQIRRSGGRTTYYGRLEWDHPAYTISTYFNRPGNGCYIHPDQDRLISFREAARLQSFPDKFRFFGSKGSIYKQIGNAVPPLLGRAIALMIEGVTAIDLFAGCGGLSKGFEMAGFEVLAGLDIDESACLTWKENHTGQVICGDISHPDTQDRLFETTTRALMGRELDAVIGGPPCQGFSMAGWRDDADPRNVLWQHYVRIVSRLSPKYVVIENVPGLLSTVANGQSVLETMRIAFAQAGYTLQWRTLAAEQYGVPQKRRRIFIIGSRHGVAPPPFPMQLTDEPHTVRDAIAGLPPLGVNDGAEAVDFRDEPEGGYQRWLRGIISVEDLLPGSRVREGALVQTSLF